MSIFRTVQVDCPSCEASVTFDLVHSVNADRRPDLREAILDRSFQRQPCPSCGYEFRIEPEFSYMDMRRGQFIAVWPSQAADDFESYEQRSRSRFEQAYGADAPPEAQDIGRLLTPRIVFGWIALNEKLIAQAGGVDDVLLELAKLALIRTDTEGPGLGVGNGAAPHRRGRGEAGAGLVPAGQRGADRRGRGLQGSSPGNRLPARPMEGPPR